MKTISVVFCKKVSVLNEAALHLKLFLGFDQLNFWQKVKSLYMEIIKIIHSFNALPENGTWI